MRPFRRAERAPAVIVEAAGLQRREKVLTFAQETQPDQSERWILGTRQALYVVTAGEKTYATLDPEVAALASSCLNRPARLTSTTTAKGGLKLTGVEPMEEAA